MSNHTHFYMIYDMAEGPVDTTADYSAAIDLAKKTSIDRIGNTIVIMKSDEAFRASPRVETIYLDYPRRPQPDMPSDPPPSPPDIV